MIVEAVVAADDSGGAALGGHRVAAHRDDFRDKRDTQPRVAFRYRDRGAQSSAAPAHDYDIGLNRLHSHPLATTALAQVMLEGLFRSRLPAGLIQVNRP
jgi:hypothetical protein